MIIKILGSGCSNCKKLEANVREAAQELGLSITIDKIQDMKDIDSYGVMSTPSLLDDESVKKIDKVATVEEIKKLFKTLNL